MKILIISDIHANFEALMAISNELESADAIIVLGDIIGYYCQVNEVIDYLREHQAVCVLGNHDYYLLHTYPTHALAPVKFGIDFANTVITPDNRKWLSNLPLIRTMVIDNYSFLVCHGSPWNPLNEYLYPNNPSIYQLKYLDYDVVAFGHTHRGFLSDIDDKILINPGSIGQSRDPATKSCACAAVLDTERMALTRIHQKFDPTPVVNLGLRYGFDERIKKYLM
jgi:putative phosphoesterase